MTHPLTDEMIEQIGQFDPDPDDMRAAYDKGGEDMLKQVIEWIKENLFWVEEDGSVRYLFGESAPINTYEITRDLVKAMRPQQQEDN